MSNHSLLLTLAATLLFYSAFSKRIDQSGISAPMLVTLMGIIVGPQLLNWVPADIQANELTMLAELTLALILFTDASQIKRAQLVRFEILPIRLLAVGLPLTMLAGWLLAVPVLELAWLPAAWLAIMLSP
ncbi:cation:proton antiporter, partial [Wenyingzhuangia sp. 1_MG-2023]|nr:cation:proton antiporter [Wenyingzhuangia sp. 1_MG-2023]